MLQLQIICSPDHLRVVFLGLNQFLIQFTNSKIVLIYTISGCKVRFVFDFFICQFFEALHINLVHQILSELQLSLFYFQFLGFSSLLLN